MMHFFLRVIELFFWPLKMTLFFHFSLTDVANLPNPKKGTFEDFTTTCLVIIYRVV